MKNKQITIVEMYGEKLGSYIRVFPGHLTGDQLIAKMKPTRWTKIENTMWDGYAIEFGEVTNDEWEDIVESIKNEGTTRWGLMMGFTHTEFEVEVSGAFL